MGIYYLCGIAYDSNYLQHHGILGQKWGIRRFQNSDGSLTAEGKKRYGNAYELSLQKKSTRWENEFNDAIMRNVKDKKVEKGIERILNNESDSSKDVLSKTELLKRSNDNLNKAFLEYSQKLYKERGKQWDGDGTEEHWALEKKYPKYKKFSEDYERDKKELIASIKRAVKTGSFNAVISDTNNLLFRHDYQRNDWTTINDGRWALIGEYLNLRYNLDLFPEDFREARKLNKGKIGDLIE